MLLFNRTILRKITGNKPPNLLAYNSLKTEYLFEI